MAQGMMCVHRMCVHRIIILIQNPVQVYRKMLSLNITLYIKYVIFYKL